MQSYIREILNLESDESKMNDASRIVGGLRRTGSPGPKKFFRAVSSEILHASRKINTK